MTDKKSANDLVGEAHELLEVSKSGRILTEGEQVAYAQVLATLALVEQQRLANQIAVESARIALESALITHEYMDSYNDFGTYLHDLSTEVGE